MELHDGDLLLRPPAPADVDAVAGACSDPEMARFLPLLPSPYERSDAESWIDRSEQAWRDGDSCPFLIVDAVSGELLGAIELRPRDGSIGYWVAARRRGEGIATRALRLVCAWRTERPLHLFTHPDNLPSQRVAEKAGFRRVGLAPHEPVFRDGTSVALRFELD